MNSSLKYVVLVIVLFVVIAGLSLIYWNRKSGSGQDVSKTTQSSSSINLATLFQSSVATSPLSPVSPFTALPDATVTVAVDAAQIEAILQTGFSKYDVRDFQGALAQFDKVIEIDPNNFIAYNARGNIFAEQEDYEAAISEYSKSINADPFFPYPYYNRGRIFRLLGKNEESLHDLRRAVALDPNEFGYRASGNIGLIHHKMEDYEKALNAFDESISYNKDERADVFYYRGETYAAMKNYQAAIIDYQAAIERFADYDAAYRSLSYAFLKRNQIEEAQNALDTALEISPNNPEAIFYQALIHLAKDQIQKAEDAVTKGLDLIDTLSEDERLKTLSRINGYLKDNTKEDQVNKQAASKLLERLPEK